MHAFTPTSLPLLLLLLLLFHQVVLEFSPRLGQEVGRSTNTIHTHKYMDKWHLHVRPEQTLWFIYAQMYVSSCQQEKNNKLQTNTQQKKILYQWKGWNQYHRTGHIHPTTLTGVYSNKGNSFAYFTSKQIDLIMTKNKSSINQEQAKAGEKPNKSLSASSLNSLSCARNKH